MSTLTSSLVVRLIDQVTGPAKKVGNALMGLNRSATGGLGTRLGDAMERNNAALDRTRGQIVDVAAGFYLLKNAITSPVRAAMEFESAMADVRKVVDFPTPKAFADFQKQLVDMSKTVPLSVNGLARIAAAAGQAGIAGDDIIKFTEAAAKIGVAFDISAETAGDSMATMMTGLGLTIDQATLLYDSMNHLSNAQASSAAGILDVVRRQGATAKTFGFNAVQVAAFASAMLSAGSESDVAATSFANMGRALTKGASATKAQKRAYKTLGMDAGKVAKSMQEDAVGTTVKVLEQIAKLPKEMQASISSDLFGNEARALGPLLTNLDLLKRSLGLIDDQAKYAGSSFNEFGVRAKTFENAVQTFDNRLTALKIVIGAALIPALNTLMERLEPIIEKITQFAQANPDLTRNVLAAAAGLVAFKVALIGLRFAGLLGRGGALSLLSLGFNTVGRAAIAARTAIAGQLGLQTALAGMSGAKLSGFGKVAESARALVRITPGLSLVGPAVSAIAAALGAVTLPMVAGIAAVAAAGVVIYKYWDRISSFVSGFARAIGEELSPAIEAVKPYLEWLKPIGEAIAGGWDRAKAAISAFGEWMGSFFSREVLTEEQKAGFERAGYDVATRLIEAVKTKVGELVTWFSGLPGRILAAIGTIDLSGIIKFPSLSAIVSKVTGGGPGPAAEPTYDAMGNVSGHRANGGPVWPGGSFLVGENEPEIFTPKTGGTITPASKSASGVEIGQIGPFHIQGGDNPTEIAREVARVFEQDLKKRLRGIHADMGARA